MDFTFSARDEEFRMKVRDFFEHEYPRDIIEKMASGASPSKEDYQRSERAMAAKGWLAVNWPKADGGTGWSANEKYIFDEELERAGALNVVPMGLLYVGPVIYTFGTEEQKKRFLPGILKSTTFWAQGYSEPGSGSDLASLQCSAVSDGDDYIVNGTKIWTSLGQHADWIFCLLRTSQEEKKQEGITFLLIDMATPGITVNPIITIDGKHSLNSVIFDNVRVPLENLVGAVNKGWSMAKALLGFERLFLGSPRQAAFALARLTDLGRHLGLSDDPVFLDRLSRHHLDLEAHKALFADFLRKIERGEAVGAEISVLKIIQSELFARITEDMLAFAGPDAGLTEALDGDALNPSALYLQARPAMIYGGSNEIQRNIIAKAVLGLPG